MTWIALGLVVCAVLAITRREGTAHPPAGVRFHAHATSSERPSAPTSREVTGGDRTSAKLSTRVNARTARHTTTGTDEVPSTSRSGDQRQTSRPSSTPELLGAGSLPDSPSAVTSPTTSLTPSSNAGGAWGQRATDRVVQSTGVLSYPADVTTAYPFVIVAGSVTAEVTWNPNTEVELSLSCPGAALRQHSSEGLIELSVRAEGGRCEAVVSDPSARPARTSYVLRLTYLAISPSTTP